MIPQHGTARSLGRRRLVDRTFFTFCILITTLSVVALVVLLGAIAYQGWEHLDLDFFNKPASRKPEKAGIFASMWGTIWICIVCALSALPIGVGTAIYLEEYARPSRLRRFIDLNITNLAGVPSIVYGVIGLTVFARMFGLFGTVRDPAIEIGNDQSFWFFRLPFGGAVIVGGLTLMLVVLPIVIVSAREALRAVPSSLREAALAAGATRWQMIRKITLPAALPGIMTGSILAISRAIGEAAPLLVVSGVLFIRFAPQHLMDQFTAMPLQIYNWAGRPQEEFHAVAATGIIALLGLLLIFNTLAIIIRQVFQKPLS